VNIPQEDEKRILYHKFHDNPERKFCQKFCSEILSEDLETCFLKLLGRWVLLLCFGQTFSQDL